MPEDKTYDSWLDAAENIPAGAIWRPHIVYQTDTSGWYWRDERDHCAEWAGSFATNEEAARAACAAHDFRPVVGQPQQDSPKGRPKPLHKTTIVIWTDYNADETEISDLAREAEVGDAYCSKRASTAVADPAKDPDWDDTEFFDSDTNSDADVEADAQHGDELPDDPIEKQKTEPVFLTSGICEDAEHLSPWDLQKLGLSFSVDTGGDPFDASQWDADNYGGDSDWYMKGYTFYPLTTAESKFVADNTFDTPEGLGIMGYSVVYQGASGSTPPSRSVTQDRTTTPNMAGSIMPMRRSPRRRRITLPVRSARSSKPSAATFTSTTTTGATTGTPSTCASPSSTPAPSARSRTTRHGLKGSSLRTEA